MAETVVAPARDATKTPPSNPPLPKQTPIKHKTVTQSFSMDSTTEMKKNYQMIALETKDHYLVGLEPERFLEAFLPWQRSTRQAYKDRVPSKQRVKSLQSVAPKPGAKESEMYEPFVVALDEWVPNKAKNPQTLRFLNTNLPDTRCNNLNPDVSIYEEEDHVTRRTNFSRQLSHVEFKPDIGHDPFQHEGDDQGNDNNQSNDEDDDGDEDEDGDEDDDGDEEDDGDEDGDGDEEDDGDEDGDGGEDSDGGEAEGNDGDEGHDDDDDDADPFLHDEPNEKINPKNQVHQEAESIASNESNIPRPSSPFHVETDTESGIHTRGQIAAYAGLALSMSFRRHFFSMLIIGRYARFIRWDRWGAVVTRRFDYTKHPMLVFDFYLRFGQLTHSQRGFDSTVQPCKNPHIPKPVCDAFNQYHKSSWYGGATFKRGGGSPSFEGFLRITVKDVVQKSTQVFFIPPPRYQRSSLFPFCRSTRRFLACPRPKQNAKEPSKMCFLKDSWHEVSLRTPREADIYRILKKEGVKYVASMRLGGDVPRLETETQQWVRELSPKYHSLQACKMVCHRIVLDTVARDLSTFSWCKVLLSCIADAVEAAQQAYSVGIMHRDLSAGNIMIVKDKETKEWRGLLIDWDMCRLWRAQGGEARRGRTGTWAFISARLLQSPVPVPHTLQDDMESAFWVLVYEALLYLKHSMDPLILFEQMQLIFSKRSRLKDGSVVGGREKLNVLLACSHNRSARFLTQFEKSGLNTFLNELGNVFDRQYYVEPNESHPDFDDPSEKWFPNFLRQTSSKMEPLSVTPTGLKSPTNDSKPPDDPTKWEPASFKDSIKDYHRMPISGNPEHSTNVQRRQESEITSSRIHGLDGSLLSLGKRSHISEPGDKEEEPLSKKHK